MQLSCWTTKYWQCSDVSNVGWQSCTCALGGDSCTWWGAAVLQLHQEGRGDTYVPYVWTYSVRCPSSRSNAHVVTKNIKPLVFMADYMKPAGGHCRMFVLTFGIPTWYRGEQDCLTDLFYFCASHYICIFILRTHWPIAAFFFNICF
jgi:hypothetical protein